MLKSVYNWGMKRCIVWFLGLGVSLSAQSPIPTIDQEPWKHHPVVPEPSTFVQVGLFLIFATLLICYTRRKQVAYK